MVNEALYKRTVDILYQAYFNNNLRHGICSACAVGNIIQANGGFGRTLPGYMITTNWEFVFCTVSSEVEGTRYQYLHPENYHGLAKDEIDSTGYTWQELASIEKAFETAPEGNTYEDWMFNGLCAVLDVLAEIHEADEPTQDATVQPFVTHYAKKQTPAI